MKAREVSKLLRRLQSGLSQGQIALRCECDNLETVYIKDDKADSVIVSDNYQTFKYLENEKDETFVAPDAIDMEAVHQVCDELGIKFREAPSDGFPSIECLVSPGDIVADAILRIAEAIDRIFHIATRNELK